MLFFFFNFSTVVPLRCAISIKVSPLRTVAEADDFSFLLFLLDFELRDELFEELFELLDFDDDLRLDDFDALLLELLLLSLADC